MVAARTTGYGSLRQTHPCGYRICARWARPDRGYPAVSSTRRRGSIRENSRRYRARTSLSLVRDHHPSRTVPAGQATRVTLAGCTWFTRRARTTGTTCRTRRSARRAPSADTGTICPTARPATTVWAVQPVTCLGTTTTAEAASECGRRTRAICTEAYTSRASRYPRRKAAWACGSCSQ